MHFLPIFPGLGVYAGHRQEQRIPLKVHGWKRIELLQTHNLFTGQCFSFFVVSPGLQAPTGSSLASDGRRTLWADLSLRPLAARPSTLMLMGGPKGPPVG